MNEASVPPPPVDQALRLPSEPYPGLRPFLDFEAALLLGRDRQVREVIERLTETQFVAVIGGSGSGKSSLIRAGVVPELRSFGIPGAGDFWVPMVTTPGTNLLQSADPSMRHTPVTRLAWRFAKLLRPAPSHEAEAARLEEIAAVFRQEAGFARLVERYSEDLLVRPGPDPQSARILFVLDQFEELFHRTNVGSDDVRVIVERVIDHFFDPHERCYVVLTMRSEHLNDCAGYLELPDAINKSSYLVRRLDDNELRDAIVGPAQCYLRLLQRQGHGASNVLPAAVAFDPALIERLQHDVGAITHDPDHLPLLQHVLARLWESACKREQVTHGVPASITWRDLSRAVRANDADSSAPLDERVNVLRASLENWAEAVYARHPREQQLRLYAVLRELAFKDPNTGMYTQQRIDVDDLRLFPGAADPRGALREIVQDGFVGSVNYLFWDDENPKRVTLKVSHESFIRGWARFRALVDDEAERFEEFVSVLRKCAVWSSGGRPPELLLESSELRRMRDARLARVFDDPVERASWFRVLLQDRDGARLAKFEPEVGRFLRESAARQKASSAHARRLRWTLGVGVLALVMLLPLTLFSLFVQAPVKERAELFFDAGQLADGARLSESYPGFADSALPLRVLIDASNRVARGRSEHEHSASIDWRTAFSAWLLETFPGMPFVADQRQFLSKIEAQAVPRVNGQVRQLLTSAIWRAGASSRNDALATPVEQPRASCEVNDGGMRPAPGRLFMRSDRRDEALQRGIFIPDAMDTRRDELVLLGASFGPGGAGCRAFDMVLPIPKRFTPVVLLDATLGHLILGVDDADRGRRSVTLYGLDWQRTREGGSWLVNLRPVAVLTGAEAFDALRREAGTAGVKAVETWEATGGRVFEVGDELWRVVTVYATPVAASPGDWVSLARAESGSACGRLMERLPIDVQPDFMATRAMYAQGRNCFQIVRGKPSPYATAPNAAPPPPGGAAAAPVRRVSATANAAADATVAVRSDAPLETEEVLVAVYAQPSDSTPDAGNVPSPLASLRQFGRFRAGQDRWFVGGSPRYEGWLALLHPSATSERYFGAPWSTSALSRLAKGVEKDQPAAPAEAVRR